MGITDELLVHPVIGIYHIKDDSVIHYMSQRNNLQYSMISVATEEILRFTKQWSVCCINLIKMTNIIHKVYSICCNLSSSHQEYINFLLCIGAIVSQGVSYFCQPLSYFTYTLTQDYIETLQINSQHQESY